jgi:hypothetical protein
MLPQWGGDIRKEGRRVNVVEIPHFILVYENGTMRPVETIAGMEGGRIKENDGGGECKYGIRTFVNVTTYPQVQQ